MRLMSGKVENAWMDGISGCACIIRGASDQRRVAAEKGSLASFSAFTCTFAAELAWGDSLASRYAINRILPRSGDSEDSGAGWRRGFGRRNLQSCRQISGCCCGDSIMIHCIIGRIVSESRISIHFVELINVGKVAALTGREIERLCAPRIVQGKLVLRDEVGRAEENL